MAHEPTYKGAGRDGRAHWYRIAPGCGYSGSNLRFSSRAGRFPIPATASGHLSLRAATAYRPCHANAYADLGETRKAIEYHQQALAISREIGDRRGEGNALGNLGNAYLELGEHEAALGHLLPSLLILGQVESPSAATVAGNIARLKENMGEGPFRALAERLGGELGVRLSVGKDGVRISPAGQEGA